MAEDICSRAGCRRTRFAEGLCWRHLRQARQVRGDTCRVAGCGRPRFTGVQCQSHVKLRHMVERACVDCGTVRFVDPYLQGTDPDRPRDMCGNCQRKRASVAGVEARLRAVADRDAEYRQRVLPVGPVSRRHADIKRVRESRSRAVSHPPLNGSFFIYGRCGWCSDSFLALCGDWERRSLYCSRLCLNAAGKYRRGRFVVPPSLRQEIYERDGWVCQLCDEPVDRTLGSSDPWAATLDHIVPRSHVLVPDDSPGNLQLAHRWCNSVKGDGSYYDVDVLKAG